MKLIRPVLFFIAFLVCHSQLTAQDFHKSLYNMMPLSFNPAFTGDFEGTVRIAGLYKDQNSGTYKTPSLSIDVPIILIRKRDWLSAGLTFDNDQAGDLGLTTNRSTLSVSYHLALDKKGEDYLVLGYQFGSESRFFKNRNDAVLTSSNDNVFNGAVLKDQSISGNFSNLGLMYRSKLDKKTDFNIGAAYLYLIRPNGEVTTSSSTGGDASRLRSEFVFHGSIDREINDKLSIHPSFLIRNRQSTEVLVQSMWGYLIRPDLQLRIKGGLGWDIDQGPALLLGADYGDWEFGASIEFPIYGVAEATNFGGFEISARRILKIYKKPVVEPTICCPDL